VLGYNGKEKDEEFDAAEYGFPYLYAVMGNGSD
jgi:hypothetical protein